jgi:hypothetical protein
MSSPSSQDRSGQYRLCFGYPSPTIDPPLATSPTSNDNASFRLHAAGCSQYDPATVALTNRPNAQSKGHPRYLQHLLPNEGTTVRSQQASSVAATQHRGHFPEPHSSQKSRHYARTPQLNETRPNMGKYPHCPHGYDHDYQTASSPYYLPPPKREAARLPLLPSSRLSNDDHLPFDLHSFELNSYGYSWQQLVRPQERSVRHQEEPVHPQHDFEDKAYGHKYATMPPYLSGFAHSGYDGYPVGPLQPRPDASTIIVDDDATSKPEAATSSTSLLRNTTKLIKAANAHSGTSINSPSKSDATERTGPQGKT